MSSGRRVVFGRQIDRREIARTPREARANMEVIDLAAKRREEANSAAATAAEEQVENEEPIAEEPAEKVQSTRRAHTEEAEERPQSNQETADDSSPAESDSESVRIRYDGNAGRFRIAGYTFKPGEVIQVSKKTSLEILTYPYERFSLVKE